jgi:translation initiation factor 1A
LLKYSADEARSLKAYGELPENTRINETDTYADENQEGMGFEFDEDRSGSEASEVDVDDI